MKRKFLLILFLNLLGLTIIGVIVWLTAFFWYQETPYWVSLPVVVVSLGSIVWGVFLIKGAYSIFKGKD